MLRSDMDIQKDIVAEFKWEPGLRNDDIAVAVRDGVVTLAGSWTAMPTSGRPSAWPAGSRG
jgi:hypothetical protein